jgi:hypothetical protein
MDELTTAAMDFRIDLGGVGAARLAPSATIADKRKLWKVHPCHIATRSRPANIINSPGDREWAFAGIRRSRG